MPETSDLIDTKDMPSDPVRKGAAKSRKKPPESSPISVCDNEIVYSASTRPESRETDSPVITASPAATPIVYVHPFERAFFQSSPLREAKRLKLIKEEAGRKVLPQPVERPQQERKAGAKLLDSLIKYNTSIKFDRLEKGMEHVELCAKDISDKDDLTKRLITWQKLLQSIIATHQCYCSYSSLVAFSASPFTRFVDKYINKLSLFREKFFPEHNLEILRTSLSEEIDSKLSVESIDKKISAINEIVPAVASIEVEDEVDDQGEIDIDRIVDNAKIKNMIAEKVNLNLCVAEFQILGLPCKSITDIRNVRQNILNHLFSIRNQPQFISELNDIKSAIDRLKEPLESFQVRTTELLKMDLERLKTSENPTRSLQYLIHEERELKSHGQSFLSSLIGFFRRSKSATKVQEFRPESVIGRGSSLSAR